MPGDAPEEIPDLDDEEAGSELPPDDETPVGDGLVARGASVIKQFWRHAPRRGDREPRR
jgi:hypothetical protein